MSVETQDDPRRRVLFCAGDLFAEHGFDDVTMADIAEAANVARATVFNYFGSKHALVETLTETVIDVFRAMLDDALADTTTPTPTLLRRLYEQMGLGIESQRGFFRGVFREIARIQLGLDEGLVAQRANDDAHARLLQLVERGQARGDLNAALDTGAVARGFRSLANGTITGWLYQDDAGSLVDAMRAAADVFLSSVERTQPAGRGSKGALR
jgi:AcrR family transcriptional regulator